VSYRTESGPDDDFPLPTTQACLERSLDAELEQSYPDPLSEMLPLNDLAFFNTATAADIGFISFKLEQALDGEILDVSIQREIEQIRLETVRLIKLLANELACQEDKHPPQKSLEHLVEQLKRSYQSEIECEETVNRQLFDINQEMKEEYKEGWKFDLTRVGKYCNIRSQEGTDYIHEQHGREFVREARETKLVAYCVSLYSLV